ncbi:hypothetical protein HAX54_051266 [Datura stramonium]|uniref:Uncharacterized protein n=1 Tax=Datura stramonium TaxID=4076 RepID=A0ABS8RRE1_DATST|nr:hypothetical protein [Datura stramonium]
MLSPAPAPVGSSLVFYLHVERWGSLFTAEEAHPLSRMAAKSPDLLLMEFSGVLSAAGEGSPFLFSRADALEMDGCDFKLADVCEATVADRAVEVKSVDGKRKITAVGGGAAANNPTAAAITHVLNNKQEFPFANSVEDLLVVSLGNGELDSGNGNVISSPAAFVKIAGDGAADMVDQAVSMAFGQFRNSNYVRVQGNEIVRKQDHMIKYKNEKISGHC